MREGQISRPGKGVRTATGSLWARYQGSVLGHTIYSLPQGAPLSASVKALTTGPCPCEGLLEAQIPHQTCDSVV